MKFFFIILILSGIRTVSAEDADTCKYFKYCGGAAPRSSKSLPSASSSANFNPSNISSIKGLGVEGLFQANNPIGYSVVSGTGSVGGALISPTLENSFFGNRSLEIDDIFLARFIEKKRYQNKKINLAVGAKIYDKSKIFALDLGVAVRRNPLIKKLNPGFGFSAKIGLLNFGGYMYKDDVKINLDPFVNPYTGIAYSTQFGQSTYQESFIVTTLTVGTKIKNLSLDYGMIKTKYKFYGEDTSINIYSTSYSLGKVLFNLAYRKEHSPNLDAKDQMLFVQKNKTDLYYGVQYMMNSHIVLGAGYNTFLLDEWSATLSLFI